MKQPSKKIPTPKHVQSPMMRMLHEKRRDEVAERFWNHLNEAPHAPMTDASTEQVQRWIPICRNLFDAGYDYHDVSGDRNLEAYKQAKILACRKIMHEGLCRNGGEAENYVNAICATAYAVTGEVHAEQKQRAKMHELGAHLDGVFGLPGSGERRLNTMTREVMQQGVVDHEDSEAVREFFLDRTDKFWNNNRAVRRLEDACLGTVYSPRGIEIAIADKFSLQHLASERHAQTNKETPPAEQVIRFLEENKLIDDAKRTWVMRQFQDKFIELAHDMVKRQRVTPGELTTKQWKACKSQFAEELDPFFKDLTVQQEQILPELMQRTEMIHDVRELHGVLTRAFDQFLAKGVAPEDRSR